MPASATARAIWSSSSTLTTGSCPMLAKGRFQRGRSIRQPERSNSGCRSSTLREIRRARHKPPPHARLLSGDLRRHYLAFPDDVWRMPTSGNAFPAWVLHRICPVPEGDYRQGADTYLTHLAPLYGPVVSIESVEADYRVHGANGFELSEATLNLDRIRRNITHSAKTRRHLLATASKHGLNQSWRGQRVESVSFYINRMISLKFDPERHPISADRLSRLLRRGSAAALRRFDVAWPMRFAYLLWFFVMAVAPRGLAQLAAELVVIPSRRRGVERLAAALGRPISEPRLMRRVPASAREAWLVVFNAGSLVGSIVINAGLGFVFWWLAARTFEPANVGLAAATIAAMTLFGTLGVLGLGTLLMGELARRDHDKWALITTAMMTAGLAGAGLGLAFVVVAPIISPDLAVLRSSPGIALLFAVGTAFTAASLVLDNALIGLLRGGIQLGRNAVFGVAKLATLVAAIGLVSASGMVIFGAWVVGAGLALLVGLSWLAFDARSWRRGLALRPRLLQGLGGSAVAHHALNVSMQATGMLMPLVVTGVLSTTANAYFYTASMVAYLIYIAPSALATVFYALGAAEPSSDMFGGCVSQSDWGWSRLSRGTWFSSWQQSLYSGSSASRMPRKHSLPCNPLALQAFTFVVREHYVAVKRVEATPAAAAPLVLAGAALKIAMAMVGAVAAGLTGLALGIVVASVIEAALMAPTIIRAAGRRAPGVGIAPPVAKGPGGADVEFRPLHNERAVRPGGR